MEHYRNLAQKIIDRYADDQMHFVVQIAADMKTREMYVIRAVGLIDSKYAVINISENYDSRKGPGVKISPDAKNDEAAVVSLDSEPKTVKKTKAAPADEGSADNIDEDDGDDEDGEDGDSTEDGMTDAESAGIAILMDRIRRTVMLDLMLGQANTAMDWILSNLEQDAFGIDDDEKVIRIMSAIDEATEALAKIKGEF